MNELLGFLFAWALRSFLVGLVGLLSAVMLRKKSAAVRHLVWRATVVAMWAIPFLLAAGPQLTTTLVTSPQVSKAIRQSPDLPSALETLRIAKTDVHLYRDTDTEAPLNPLDPWMLVSVVYLLGVGVALRRWVASFRSLKSVAMFADEFEHGESTIPVRVAQDPALRVPVTFGWRCPIILLPSEAHEWPESRRTAAILHEQAHVARRDWPWLCLGQALQAIQWFNPAAWLCGEALRSTAEEAADDQVLTSGIPSLQYASELLSVAEASRGHLQASLAMARQSGLKARLKRILASNQDRSLPSLKFVAAIGCTLSLSGVLLSVSQVAIAQGPGEIINRAIQTAVRSYGDEPNVQKLPSGAKVSISFLASNDPKIRLWLKDGSPAGDSDYQDLAKAASGGASGLWRMTNLKGNRSIGVGIRVTDAGSNLVTPQGRFDNQPVSFTLGQLGGSLGARTSIHWCPIALSSTQKAADITIGVACTPYKTVESSAIGYGPLEAIAHERIQSQSGTYDPATKKRDVVVRYDPRHILSTVRVLVPVKYTDMDLILAAFATDGSEIRTDQGSCPPHLIDGKYYAEQDFYAGDPKKIARIELRARDFEWVTFHDVRLYPSSTP
jgi:beta-lactamase regulating signal transducer with metallopeptidase domain